MEYLETLQLCVILYLVFPILVPFTLKPSFIININQALIHDRSNLSVILSTYDY